MPFMVPRGIFRRMRMLILVKNRLLGTRIGAQRTACFKEDIKERKSKVNQEQVVSHTSEPFTTQFQESWLKRHYEPDRLSPNLDKLGLV